MENQELKDALRDYIHCLTGDAAPGEREKHRDALRHQLKQAGYLSGAIERESGRAIERESEKSLELEQPRRAGLSPEALRQRWREAAGAEDKSVTVAPAPAHHCPPAFLLLSALVMVLVVLAVWYLPPRLLPALSPTMGGQAAGVSLFYRSIVPALYRSTALSLYRFQGGARW